MTISQKDYTEDVVQLYGMGSHNTAYTLKQPDEKLLNKEEKRRY